MDITQIFNTVTICHPEVLLEVLQGPHSEYRLCHVAQLLATLNQTLSNFGFCHKFELSKRFSGFERVSESGRSTCDVKFADFSGEWPRHDFATCHAFRSIDSDIVFHDTRSKVSLSLQLSSTIWAGDLPNFTGWNDIEKQIVLKTFEQQFVVSPPNDTVLENLQKI